GFRRNELALATGCKLELKWGECDYLDLKTNWPMAQAYERNALGLGREFVPAKTLPHPLTSNPFLRPDRILARRDLILARFHGRDVVIPIEEEVDSIVLPVIEAPLIPPVVDSMLQDTLHVRTDTGADSLRATTRDTTRDTVRRVSRRGAAASPRP